MTPRKYPRRLLGSALACALVTCAALTPQVDAGARAGRCPGGMSLVEAPADAGAGAHAPFCIDRYEAAVVEITPEGEAPFSPYASVFGHKVKAVSRQGVVPQAYISRNEAEGACKAARKRLCAEDEWVRACVGRNPTTFPYGDERKTGYCNDHGKPPLATYYAGAGDAGFTYEPMNDPRLNQMPGTVARTGAFLRCRSSWGPFDMVGNVHEWIDDPNGTFLGGYYLDTAINGDGCHYKTVAHDATYHDYSTGFRCCVAAR